MSLPTTNLQYTVKPLSGEGYNSLAIQEVPIPTLKSDDVLLKTHAVSLNYRDLLIAVNDYVHQMPASTVPTSDMAGEVIAVGEDVEDFKVGDRVCPNFNPEHLDGISRDDSAILGSIAPGVLTKYKIFKPRSLVKIPDHLSYEEASALPCAAVTAYNALLGHVPMKAGDTVLVQGTGGVSIFGLQLAVVSGATVIVTSSSDDKLKLAKKLGAKHLINYKKTPDWAAEVLKITGGYGVDHILEVGGEGTFEKSLACAAIGGNINIIGMVAGTGPSDVIIPSISRALILRGVRIGSVAQFKNLMRVLDSNPEATRPVVDKVFAWGEAKEAYAYFQSQAHVGKVVIKVSSN